MLIISACLAGKNCRRNGRDKPDLRRCQIESSI